MAKRDPHDVLGTSPGASLETIKAAWRRLARQHHPDLTGDDPAASQKATRLMAEINDAYERLRRLTEAGDFASANAADGASDVNGQARRAGRGGPPKPRPSRPVTGRVDTSETLRPRNATTHRNTSLGGQPPRTRETVGREPLRASDPNGPLERGRIHRFRRPPPPKLDVSLGHELEFGKFRGHTLGQVADFEPSYIDWLASTITRDPDLVARARVVQEDLDRRGVLRRARPAAAAPSGRSA